MFVVIGIMLTGVVVGYFLQSYKMGAINKLITVAIFLLLFLLGVAVGNNPQIMNNLGTIGLKGLLIAFASVMGSVLMAWGIYHWMIGKKEQQHEG